MSVILSVYSRDAFREFILPSINDADYSIRLEKEHFCLKQDVILKLEILGDAWKIRPDEAYRISRGEKPYGGGTLQDGNILSMETLAGERVSIIVKDTASVFHGYEKYLLPARGEITVGRDPDRDISYNCMEMVSRLHAVIRREGDICVIENRGQNGTYVNSRKVEGQQRLAFGDYINVIGLHMVYLGPILAVDVEGKDVRVNSRVLSLWTAPEDSAARQGDRGEYRESRIYHRAPRSYEKLDEQTIEIEGPPDKVQTRNTSLISLVGPSLTMALPMVLGCMLMVYASRSSGMNNSLFMYSGLVMAVSSALLGVVWGVVNARNEKKEALAKEEHRFQAYGEYLVEQSDQIRRIYNDTTNQLRRTYPGASECLESSVAAGTLWNRNHTHDDFLKHRLGLGERPFQVLIDVPKKRFRLHKDDLSDKPAMIRDEFSRLYDVPVNVDLQENHLIGIVGGKGQRGAIRISRILSAQIAAGNCYTDVKLGYIYDRRNPEIEKEWDFAKWLPHVWSEDKRTRYVASTREEVSEVFYELAKVFRARMEDQDRSEGIPKPYYVIFISDLSMLEGEMFSRYVFGKDPRCGLTTVFLAETCEELPNSCDFVIENDALYQGMYHLQDRAAERCAIRFDDVSAGELNRFARSTAGRKVVEIESGGEIPGSITFFEMMGVNRPEEIPAAELWAKNRTYDNIRGLVGQKSGGTPCYLDVHEKYHGPHGLVAGTTGSGKSETLQTYMLSLAVNYSPNDVGFFVIDYKGGGMANLFDGLPHMVGQISNLSGNQVKRAMVSIKSENKRRQRVFNENGVNNINAYTKLVKNGEASLPVPHLFIIIDEFAELKREEPEFMKELISVAQVGRSLGVHLILATQKPSGTVDDNIWSNARFRLCLRVQDRQDSSDMLHKPDAAYITQAGRCYLQVGSDEVYELFQSGYSGAAYDKDAAEQRTEIAKLIGLNGKVEMTGSSAKASRRKKAQALWNEQLIEYVNRGSERNHIALSSAVKQPAKMSTVISSVYGYMEEDGVAYERSPYNTERLENFILLYQGLIDPKVGMQGSMTDIAEEIAMQGALRKLKLPQRKEISQLEAVKEYLAKIARENGYDYKLQLWMPVLPEQLYLMELEIPESEDGDEEEFRLIIPMGKLDDPENQEQPVLTMDLARTGHVAVCGSVVSGKSTMMQTMIYGLITRYTPAQVNIYALDFSAKLLSAFEDAPHVGGIMYEGDTEKIGKFFNMLDTMLEERKGLFRGGNYSQYRKVHGDALPAVVLFVDNYGAFKEKTQEQYEERMIRLAKEGVNQGIYLVVSGMGYGMSDITQRVADNIGKVYCLNLPEKFAYSDLLHTNRFDVLPESTRGRGLVTVGERVLEYQTALALPAENDYERMEKIRSSCRELAESWTGRTARRIPEIPKKPVWSLFRELEDFETMCRSAEYLPIGYDGANAAVYGIPLRSTWCYTIWGGARTGKTNLLKVALQSALCKDSMICVMDDRSCSLRAYEQEEKITYCSDEESLYHFLSEQLRLEFLRRNRMKQALLAEDLEEDEIFDRMSQETPIFIFISDLNQFVQLVYRAQSHPDMKDYLEMIVAKGFLHNIYMISDVNIRDGSSAAGYPIYDLFTGKKTGLHLGGKLDENTVLDYEYMNYNERMKSCKPGIAQIPGAVGEHDTRQVVIPLARR